METSPTNYFLGSLGRYLPLVAPLVACCVLQASMHPVALREAPGIDPVFKYLVYDESDLTAMALRGVNGKLGRLPGRRDEPPVYAPREVFEHYLDHSSLPRADRFYLEYPTWTLLLFERAFWGNMSHFSTPVLDSHQDGISKHLPRSDEERAIWGDLNFAVRSYVVLMTLGLIGLMLVLGWGYGTSDCQGGSVWLLMLPGCLYFGLNRFDVLPTLAMALSFACLGRRYLLAAGGLIAVGTLLKVYPALLIPVVLRYLGWRDSVRYCLGGLMITAVALAWSVARFGWEGTFSPIQVQLNRVADVAGYWTFYGQMLPKGLAHWKEGRLGLIFLTILLACLTQPRSLASVLRRGVAVLLVFNVLAVFWSPQWMIWFLPLLVPLSRQCRWAFWAVVMQDLLNYLGFPVMFHIAYEMLHPSQTQLIVSLLLVARFAFTVWLLGLLTWQGCTSGEQASRAIDIK